MGLIASQQPIPPPPVVSNEYIADLLTKQIQLLQEQNNILRKENSEWLEADDAAAMLGKIWTKSGRHLDVLRHLRRKHHLTTFGQMRPYTYLRDEVEAVLYKVKAGKLVLP